MRRRGASATSGPVGHRQAVWARPAVWARRVVSEQLVAPAVPRVRRGPVGQAARQMPDQTAQPAGVQVRVVAAALPAAVAPRVEVAVPVVALGVRAAVLVAPREEPAACHRMPAPGSLSL